jgi:hypothetical protein
MRYRYSIIRSFAASVLLRPAQIGDISPPFYPTPSSEEAPEMKSINRFSILIVLGLFALFPKSALLCGTETRCDVKLSKDGEVKSRIRDKSILARKSNASVESTTLLDKNEEVRHLIGEMAEDKTKVRNYAKQLKEKYKDNENDPDFLAARALYVEAQAKYMNYLSQFTEAIRAGQERHLDEDEQFNQVGTEAHKLASDFIKNADELTNVSIAAGSKGLPSLGDFVDAAIKIWKAWKDEKRKQRNERADRLSKELAWADWSDIKI